MVNPPNERKVETAADREPGQAARLSDGVRFLGLISHDVFADSPSMSTTKDSSVSGHRSSWLSFSILVAMSLVLLAVAAGARLDDGRFVYRTWLFLAAGIGSMVTALAIWFRK